MKKNRFPPQSQLRGKYLKVQQAEFKILTVITEFLFVHFPGEGW